MNPDPAKLRHQQNEQHSVDFHQNQTHQDQREFATAEEMIRYDVEQTTVPDEIAKRLSTSIQSEPKPANSWWRRWFSPSE